jgi:radical SAM protein with 4Fe4S-binding SPASM domain
MNTEDIKRLIDEASKMGCNKFTFSGGEPFLRKDIFEIIEYCKGKKVNFLTNGTLLTKTFIKKLASFPQIDEIKITLDGFEGHNILRKGSDYKKVIESIENLKKEKMKVVINTEVTAINLHEMPKLYSLLKELRVDRWRVDLPFLAGRYIENFNNFKLPKLEDFILVFKKILIDYLKKKPSFELELFNIYKSEITPQNFVQFDENVHPCVYIVGSVPLKPNGDLLFCTSLEIPMANFLKEGSLKKALDKKYTNKLYDLKVADIVECRGCRYLPLCGTGCRANSYYYFGRLNKPDPLACDLMPLIEKEIIPILPKDIKEFFISLIDKKGKFPPYFEINELVKNRLSEKLTI